jgi:hypothetical protein
MAQLPLKTNVPSERLKAAKVWWENKKGKTLIANLQSLCIRNDICPLFTGKTNQKEKL